MNEKDFIKGNSELDYVAYCSYLNKENKELKNKIYKILDFINKSKYKVIAPYGDNEDIDYEICLDKNDIEELEKIINGI